MLMLYKDHLKLGGVMVKVDVIQGPSQVFWGGVRVNADVIQGPSQVWVWQQWVMPGLGLGLG